MASYRYVICGYLIRMKLHKVTQRNVNKTLMHQLLRHHGFCRSPVIDGEDRHVPTLLYTVIKLRDIVLTERPLKADMTNYTIK
jgi:hypothetical protein